MLLRNRNVVKRKRKLVCGAGHNDADYIVSKRKLGKQVWICPFYRTWKGMLERCYSEVWLKTFPTYKGSRVCDEWLTFSNFRLWMETQQWIKFDDTDECNIVRLQLDKDLLSGGKRGKLYSPETCVFISNKLNTFLLDCEKSRGDHPLGVYYNKKKFLARACNPFTGKQEYLGIFNTPEEAQLAYIARKTEFAFRMAEEQTDPRIKDALLKMDWSK